MPSHEHILFEHSKRTHSPLSALDSLRTTAGGRGSKHQAECQRRAACPYATL